MSEPRLQPPRRLPPWLMIAISAVIAFHLFAIAVLVVAAPSGPWPSMFGSNMAMEPQFAASVSNFTTRYYLRHLKMTHNYHFMANRVASPATFFDVNLKDDKGKVFKTVRFPEKDNNFWVWHRQRLLAHGLVDDQPVEVRPGEVIPAPGQKVQQQTIWDLAPDKSLRIRSMPEHLVPRDRPVFRPSAWSLVLAKAYMRYLCREHGAASAELIRHSREPIMPGVMFENDLPAQIFEELTATFGEVKK